ncbi:ParB/RepB/Spo0J family partition protein [Aureimonas pseudogalii]|uniref:ParB family chromosome partitioning protein n=1 Tax=Aureimonas pseudogalii TaxID=1744844 RepID=A0A7W6H747_9HYPH|nr:ParB/RepB/Spo0J family partition protein [Aureimonas pseudogalii]MBB3999752.1 ParB family chromosome partitioning protein [Aureimonas pseudogalii]
MATAVQKITLASARDIPFNKLVLSQSNVRRVKAGVSIEEMAASIARRGLIQSLHVRAVLDAEGAETGMFEVPAGGRRYLALELLVKQKRLNKTAPVPCVVSDAASGVLIDEVSLAENIERAPLHPLDQYRAFQAMRDKGMTEEGIAAAFFVGVNVVKQRLRLAAVSPVLLDLYAEDGMTLEQLMAFTVSPDHARQEQVWEAIKKSYGREPWQVRRMLTETAVRASDKRARFVGIEAYETEGGVVLRDLFESDDGGWLQDAALLDRLAADRLRVIADEIAGEGWKWIEAAISLPYGVNQGLRDLVGPQVDLTDEEQATVDALNAELERLEAEYQDAPELPDDVDERLGEIETALAAFDERPVQYDPAEIARAGVFVSIGSDGSLVVDRGYVRPEDEAPAVADADDRAVSSASDSAELRDGEAAFAPIVQRAVVTVGGAPVVQPEPEEEDGIRPLPDRLLSELTAHRTLALRDAVAGNPHVAMTALLHKLVRDTFGLGSTTGAIEASVREVYLAVQADDLKDSASARSVDERHEGWKADLPEDDEALWDWLAALDEASRMALLAHCVSYGVNALYQKPNPFGGSGVSEQGLRVRLAEADRLARATGLDMVEAGWRPTVRNYLGTVTKARIVEAVREGAGERAAQLIDHLKKGDMAKEAERLLADSGWLPEPLRLANLGDERIAADAAIETEGTGAEGEADVLPAFLANMGDEPAIGDDPAANDGDEFVHAVAAE